MANSKIAAIVQIVENTYLISNTLRSEIKIPTLIFLGY